MPQTQAMIWLCNFLALPLDCWNVQRQWPQLGMRVMSVSLQNPEWKRGLGESRDLPEADVCFPFFSDLCWNLMIYGNRWEIIQIIGNEGALLLKSIPIKIRVVSKKVLDSVLKPVLLFLRLPHPHQVPHGSSSLPDPVTWSGCSPVAECMAPTPILAALFLASISLGSQSQVQAWIQVLSMLIPIVKAFVLHDCINIRESLAKALVIIHLCICGHWWSLKCRLLSSKRKQT